MTAVAVGIPAAAAATTTTTTTTPAGSGQPSPGQPSPGQPSVRLPLPGATVPAWRPEVLPALPSSGPVPSPAGLSVRLGALLARPALGPSVGAEVIDIATGTPLYTRNADRGAAPASTAKVLTAAAALTVLGPDTTLSTRAVRGRRVDEVVLVGGGDVLLGPGRGDPDAVHGRAGLADLADATAASLRAAATTSVTVRLDDTLFSGPAVNPSWSAGDVQGGFVAPVMAVEVTVGVAEPGVPPQAGLPAARLADPAMSAVQQFAALLRARGISVTGQVTRSPAPAQPTLLAEVRSASIADIVELDLTDSDNTTAEALARLVALAGGRRGTFQDGGRAVLEQISHLGVPTAGATMTGGSGLGRGTVLTAGTVARTLALAGSAEHPQLRAVLSGLPVAAASGTLADRFATAGTAGGAGVVRAKTGTLTGVSSLAGTVVDLDGRLLAFAVMADAVPATTPARAALDEVATALAGCGCR